jgi:hypothetical protein
MRITQQTVYYYYKPCTRTIACGFIACDVQQSAAHIASPASPIISLQRLLSRNCAGLIESQVAKSKTVEEARL